MLGLLQNLQHSPLLYTGRDEPATGLSGLRRRLEAVQVHCQAVRLLLQEVPGDDLEGLLYIR